MSMILIRLNDFSLLMISLVIILSLMQFQYGVVALSEYFNKLFIGGTLGNWSTASSTADITVGLY